MQLNFNDINTYNAILYFNEVEAFYKFENSDTLVNNDLGLKETEKNNFSIKFKDKTKYYIKSDKKTNKITELKKGLGKEEFLHIIEAMPKIDWHILKEKKIIDGYLCNMAKCTYKGRNYTVWFTTKIYSVFGPWKLHGLPGLILEASDDTNEVLFFVEKIEKIKTPLFKIKKYREITPKEYNKMINNALEELGKKMASKTERGFKISVKTTKLKSIEIDN